MTVPDCVRWEILVKVEVTSDPTTTGDTYDEAVSFLAPWVCSIQKKKIIAQYHWGFKELWSFKTRYHHQDYHLYTITFKHVLLFN